MTAASKYGATTDIANANAIARAIGEVGHDMTVLGPEDVASVDDQDAVVIGSAVYAGHWLEPATQFIIRYAEALRARPVWLFSSGPVGDPPKPGEEPVDAARMIEVSGAREHKVFAGRLERSRLRFADKAIVVALRAPEGDFRDFEQIRTWARGIAGELRESSDAS